MTLSEKVIREQDLYNEIARLEHEIAQLKARIPSGNMVAVILDEKEWDYYIFHISNFQGTIVEEFLKKVCDQLVGDVTKGNAI